MKWLLAWCCLRLLDGSEGIGDNAGQLGQVDVQHGSTLKKWSTLESSSSLMLVLAGDPQTHLTALKQALGFWNPTSFKNAGNIKILQSDFILENIASWLSSRFTQAHIPWSVIFIQHAEDLNEIVLKELVLKYSNKQKCIDPENKLFVENCEKLLIILSSNFGESAALPELRESKSGFGNPDTLKVLCEKEFRLKWPILAKISRRILRPLMAPPNRVQGARLLEFLKSERRSRSKIHESKCLDMIDETVLDAEFSGFIGQNHVVQQVQNTLAAVKAGLKTGNGPLVMLFVGPAGLGKTYLASMIARAYNCGMSVRQLEQSGKLLQIDMGNYKSDRDIDGFIDPTPGLAGTGLISTAFSKEPRIVVVLDEIEKAHPTLLREMLLPMLDNTDGHVQVKKSGIRIPTKDAIFILTTNCLSSEIAKMATFCKSSIDSFSKSVATRLRDSDAACEKGIPNPFASEPLWRRLVAGHALSNANGLFVFVPPSQDEIKQVVENTMHRYAEDLPHVNLYFTKDVVRFFQIGMMKEFKSGNQNMGTVSSFVQRPIAEMVMRHQSTMAHNADVLVYFNNDQQLFPLVVNNMSPTFKNSDSVSNSLKFDKPIEFEKQVEFGKPIEFEKQVEFENQVESENQVEFEKQVELEKEASIETDSVFSFKLSYLLEWHTQVLLAVVLAFAAMYLFFPSVAIFLLQPLLNALWSYAILPIALGLVAFLFLPTGVITWMIEHRNIIAKLLAFFILVEVIRRLVAPLIALKPKHHLFETKFRPTRRLSF